MQPLTQGRLIPRKRLINLFDVESQFHFDEYYIKVLENKAGSALITAKTKDGGYSVSVKVIVMSNDKENKKAHYTCAIVLVYPDGKTLSAEGYLHGEITENRAGTNGFGYDPYFYLPEYGCTTAELDPEIKNKISHRGNAIRALVEKLKNQ